MAELGMLSLDLWGGGYEFCGQQMLTPPGAYSSNLLCHLTVSLFKTTVVFAF